MDAKQEAEAIVARISGAKRRQEYARKGGKVFYEDVLTEDAESLVRIVAAAIEFEEACSKAEEDWRTDTVKRTWHTEAELVAAVRAALGKDQA